MKGLDPLTRVEASVDSGIYINATSPAYGAVGDGVVDDTAAIQLALDAAYAIGAGTVYLPYGTYKLTSTLEIGDNAGFSSIGLMGAGGVVGTTLNWAGSTSGVAVKILKGRDNQLTGFSIMNTVAIGTTIGLQMTGSGVGSQCSGVTFTNVLVRDFKVNIQAGDVGGTAAASEIVFINTKCDSTGAGGTGLLTTSTGNSVVISLINSSFGPNLDVGIDIVTGGDTHIYGGGFGRNVVDIKSQITGGTLSIIGPRFELNPTEIAVQTTNPTAVSIICPSFNAVSTVPSVPVIQGKGQFSIKCGRWGSGSNTGWKTIEVDTQSTNGHLEMTGCKIWGTTPFYIDGSSSTSNYLTYDLSGNEKWASSAFSSRFPDEQGQVIWPDKSSFKTLGSGFGGSSYSPSQITANQNDYQPQNINTSGAIPMPMYLHLSTDASRNITGMKFSVDPVDGDSFILTNAGSNNIVLKHQDTNSTAAYRMKMVTAGDITLGADQWAHFAYRGGSVNRWLVYSISVSGFAQTGTTNSFSETQTFSKAPVVPTSAGTAVWGLDASAGATLSIANDATATPFSNANNFSGLLMINDPDQTGQTGLFIVGGSAAVVLIGQSGSLYSHTATTAGKVNVYANAGVVTIENKQGNTIGFRVLALRLRTSG